jgi:hypothetical protein
MPSVRCDRCGASTKRSGIVQHCRLSQNPACRTFLKDLLDTANEVAEQIRAEDLEGHVQGNDEIGTEMTYMLSPNLY